MSDVTVLETPVVVPAEALVVTPPTTPTQSMAEASADFIAKYRTQEGAKAPETVVPAPGAPEVPVVEGEKPIEAAPDGEKPVEGDKPEAEKPVESKFRNADGTFAKTIKAKFGETDFEVPEGLLVPIKRGDTVEFKPLAEIQKEGMLYNDYNKSKQELADQRRTMTAETAAAQAETKVWKAITKEILENPGKAMKYRQDPELAGLWADAAEGRLVAARTEALAQVSQQDASQEAVARIQSWAEAMAGEFPGVDPQAVLREYGDFLYQHGEAVKAGRALEDPGAISMDRLRTYFTTHHSRVASVVNPLQARLEAAEKALAELKAQQGADATKKVVQHAAARQATPPVIAGQGGVTQGNTGAVTGQNGQKLDLNTASKEFLKRYQ